MFGDHNTQERIEKLETLSSDLQRKVADFSTRLERIEQTLKMNCQRQSQVSW
ncbi:MAG: hypothetical protein M1150_02385 [Patescibacteria group bacterium]|nr:hypothetical protein [Patescibacteria group bacterium]